MQIPASFFGSISVDTFLKEYWQKKPLLVRGAWPKFESPLSPDDFLDLSSRHDAYSRLLVKGDGEHDWDVREGPFNRATFENMPDTQWTLLIQEVDRLVSEVRKMLEVVSFLPNWRLDDVMISYAARGGGVGAHIDNYDVFLLQGYGSRRWQIDTKPVLEERLIEDIDVSILADFKPDSDWVLEVGDMLYLPPRIAHHGVALGPCMTYSIGCRAPGALEMLTGVLEQVLEELDPEERLTDPDLLRMVHSGKLDERAIRWVQSLLNRVAEDEEALTDLVGKMLSEPRRLVEDDGMLGASFSEQFSSGAALRPTSLSQILYSTGPASSPESRLTLYAGGEVIELDPSLLSAVQALSSPGGLLKSQHRLDPGFVELLKELWEQGTLLFHRPSGQSG